VPWVVEVDKLGQTQAVAPATATYSPTDPQIAFHLAQFVANVRSLPNDAVVVRGNWLKAYDFTTDKGSQVLNGYAQANDPFGKVGIVQVAVEVTSVIRASPDSFRVTWTERRFTGGQLNATQRWSAIVSLVIDPPHDPERLRKNPLGIYVNAINWSQEFSS
jgi:type IV secretory pathway TrbF-like protein